MFERERTDTESIDFDFFEDSPTVEEAREEPAPKRRRRLPARPPTGGPRLLRLAGLIAGLILLSAVVVLWVSSCREDQRLAAYRDYMEAVGQVGGESATIGRELNQVVFTSGIAVEDLQSQLDGLRGRQSQNVRQAEELDPPGALREQHESLVEALQLRVSGLNGLARAFSQISDEQAAGGQDADAQADDAQADDAQAGDAQTGDGEDADAVGELLAQQSNRLVASDVLYEDFFKAPAQEVMRREGVTDVVVPESPFVTNVEFASPNSWTLILERLTQPAGQQAGGLHGNSLAGVRALPGGKELSPSEENTVQASDRLAFEVLVENSGDNQETQVNVSFTIQQSPEPIRKEATIDAINPGDTKVVTFADLGAVSFGSRTIVKVTVEPVPGEENTNNNTAEYVVFFTFAG